MCRWLACSGSPVLLKDLLDKPEHSLAGSSSPEVRAQLLHNPSATPEVLVRFQAGSTLRNTPGAA